MQQRLRDRWASCSATSLARGNVGSSRRYRLPEQSGPNQTAGPSSRRRALSVPPAGHVRRAPAKGRVRVRLQVAPASSRGRRGGGQQLADGACRSVRARVDKRPTSTRRRSARRRLAVKSFDELAGSDGALRGGMNRSERHRRRGAGPGSGGGDASARLRSSRRGRPAARKSRERIPRSAQTARNAAPPTHASGRGQRRSNAAAAAARRWTVDAG